MTLTELAWRETGFAALDFETTGRDASTDRIIEIGIAVFSQGEVVDRWQQLVQPGFTLPEEITRITNITDEMLADAPTFDAVADELARRLDGRVLLAYNHEFDLGFLVAEFARLGRPIVPGPCLDPYPFVWKHLQLEAKAIRNAKLGTAAEYLGIPLDHAHRADYDAEAAGRVLLALDERADLPSRVGEMIEVQAMIDTMRAERFRRGRPGGGAALQGGDTTIGLGAAYVYGPEADPVRALIQQLPDARDRA